MPKQFKTLLTQVDSEPLSTTLPKVIRLAHRASDEELENWARLELLGYFNTNPALKEESVVPEYRTIAGQWYDEFQRPFVFQDPSLGFVNEVRLRNGVAELEGFEITQETLAARFPEVSELIRDNLEVDVSIFRFNPAAVASVIAGIRSQLSDKLTQKSEQLDTPQNLEAIKTNGEILELRPNFFGLGVNLRALWRKIQSLRVKKR